MCIDREGGRRREKEEDEEEEEEIEAQMTRRLQRSGLLTKCVLICLAVYTFPRLRTLPGKMPSILPL